MGFADGTFINVEFDEDSVAKTVGAQGAVTATMNAHRGGKATFTILQGSPTNDLLSALAASSRPSNAALIVRPLFIKDLNGTTLVSAAEAWVLKVPNTEFGKEVASREWVIDIARLQMHTGGAVR